MTVTITASTTTIEINGQQIILGSEGGSGGGATQWFTQSGAPDNGTGDIGDFSIDTANGDFYEKTGATVWTLRGNLTGPAGAAGIQGPGGGLKLVSRRIIGGGLTNLDFLNLDQGGYDGFVLKLYHLIPSTDNVTFEMLTSSDNGISFDTVSGDYRYSYVDHQLANASPINGGNASAPSILLSGSINVGNAVGEDGVSGEIEIFNPNSPYKTFISAVLGRQAITGTPYKTETHGIRMASELVNAVRFRFNSGQINSGVASLFGVMSS